MSIYDLKSFTNYTDENFKCSWDGEPYTVAAGETRQFPPFLAEVFAKHFADRELNKAGKSTGDKKAKAEIFEKCLGITIKVEEKEEEKSDGAKLKEEIEEKEEEFTDLKEEKPKKSKKKAAPKKASKK